MRGDINGDTQVDISDMVSCLTYLFLGTETPTCMKAADVNDDSAVGYPSVDVSDPIYGLNRLFLGGPPIPPPAESCGLDPTDDALTCESHGPCQ